MPHELYELPKNFDGTARLFPLPDLVVFPRAIQGLHIFELRYCEMLEDALQRDQLITTATLLPGSKSDYYGCAEISPNVCIGRITAHQRNEDGTHDLALLGLRRAKIVKEKPMQRAYREAVVRVIEDLEPPASDSAAQHVAAELAICLKRRIAGAEILVDEFLQGGISMGLLTDMVAFHLPMDASLKLDLLEQVDVVQRARMLLAQLTRRARPKEPASNFPPEFSSN